MMACRRPKTMKLTKGRTLGTGKNQSSCIKIFTDQSKNILPENDKTLQLGNLFLIFQ